MFKFENRDKVTEITTGFKGTIICREQWANGQITYCVQPPADGSSLPTFEIFDEMFLEITDETKITGFEGERV